MIYFFLLFLMKILLIFKEIFFYKQIFFFFIEEKIFYEMDYKSIKLIDNILFRLDLKYF
jgi:hypothetical protein